MTQQGWIKLHRSVLDHDLWLCEKFTKGQAWIDLILGANHKDGFFYVRGNKVELKRGQNGRSELTLAKRWRWSRGKVRRFLNELKMVHMVELKRDTKTTITTICNYDKYQQICTTDSTTDGQQTVQQTDNRRYTNKNVENEKNVKNLCQETTQTVKEIINYLNLKTGKNYKHTTVPSITSIKARLNEGFQLKDFKTVIDNKTSAWRNDTEMVKYLRPQTLFGGKFEAYLNERISITKKYEDNGKSDYERLMEKI